jgi:hypothetical protein
MMFLLVRGFFSFCFWLLFMLLFKSGKSELSDKLASRYYQLNKKKLIFKAEKISLKGIKVKRSVLPTHYVFYAA